MKSFFKILAFVITILFGSAPQARAQQADVSYQIFYDQLSPYGDWVNYQDYGYVWIPDADPEFEPYSTDGHWVFTEYGWTWMSNYPWGWAPFHYGRWDYDNYYGWLWIPGNEWGPAWVSWRRADGYYGWAPMGPGITLSISFGSSYDSSNDHWIFVRDRDIVRSDINHYYISSNDRYRIVRNSTVINNSYTDSRRQTKYAAGPTREDFQKSTGRQVIPVAIQEYNEPGRNENNGHVGIYRPEIRRNDNKGRDVSPTRVTNLKDVKRPSERNGKREINTRRETQTETTQPTNNQPQNIRRESQKETKQETNNSQNIRRESQKETKQDQSTPPQNTREEQKNTNEVKIRPSQNTGREENNKNVVKTNPSQNTRREQANDQEKKSKTDNDKKK